MWVLVLLSPNLTLSSIFKEGGKNSEGGLAHRLRKLTTLLNRLCSWHLMTLWQLREHAGGLSPKGAKTFLSGQKRTRHVMAQEN